MPFGGEVKLTGESEYRKAIESITSDLGKMSTALQKQAQDFSANDKNMKNSEQRQKELNEALQKEQAELAKAKTAYAQYSVAVQTQQQRHKELSKEYNNAVKELDRIGKECGETSDEYKAQSKVVDQLGDELAKSNEEMNDSKQAMNKLKGEINSSQKVIDQTTKEIDELGTETEKSGKEADDSSKKWEKFGSIVGKVGKAIGVSIGAISAVAVGAGKALWDMSSDIAKTGDEIDKQSQKLGISAENYQALSYAMERSGADINDLSKGMKTITSELAKAENGAKGAGDKFAELGVSLTNADGSMKSSEQVMLESIDALSKMENETQRNALAQQIFGKSASELAPLLNSGSEGIHELMQEAKDYGMVMSDDAVKASATFEDSMTRMNGTLNGLKNNMIGSFLPSLTTLIDGFTDLIAGVDGAGEKIKEGVTGIIENITSLVPKATEIISTLASAVLESAPSIISSLAQGILTAIPTLMPVISGLISDLLGMISELFPQMLTAGMEVITSLMQGITEVIPDLIAMLPELIQSMVDTLDEGLPDLVQTGLDLLVALIEGISKAIPQLVGMLPTIIITIVNTLMNNLPQIINAGVKILTSLISGIIKTIPQLVSSIPKIITSFVNTVSQNLPKILKSGVDVLTKFVSGITQNISKVVTGVGKVAQAVIKGLSKLPSQVVSIGSNVVRGVWNGISNVTGWILDKIRGFGSSVLNGIKKIFGIASPSKVMEKEVGVYLAQGIGMGFEDEMKDVTKQMQSAIPSSFDTNVNVNGSSGGTGYALMVTAFKDALSQMKIELDDDEVGRFIDKTVTRLVYN